MFTLSMALLATALIAATYTDLRWTEVPDWLSYATIATALALALLTSINTASTTPLLNALLGLVVYSALGLTLFYLGQWGGGDTKLLMGVGAMLGFSTSPTSPFVLYLASLLLMGGAYSLIWTGIVAAKHHTIILQHVKIAYQRKGIMRAQLTLAALGIALAGLVLSLPLAITERVIAIASALALPLLLTLFITLRTIETHCFRKHVTPGELIEGDWVAEPVVHNKKVIYTPHATGLTRDDIERIKRSGAQHILIKSGIPFIPSFLLALIPLFFL